ncbi:MAG TPA: hypothetical protein VMD74_03745 [Candidatus Methylomirabilis sp.]|nr:hypothetical protein [Candidatus Methylomirabilis sp.]
MKRNLFDLSAQIFIPLLTIGGQLAIALKFPAWGLILVLASQPFWLYSSWKAWKNADQIGLLINSIIFAAVTALGVINYWFIK